MKGMIKKKPGEASWITYIKKRIDNHLNFLSITTGSPGAGKSYTDLSIAYQLDPEFDVRRQVVFGFSPFMKAINLFNETNEEEVAEGVIPLCKKKYKVIIFEESQVIVNKREWQSKINKLFLYLMSTFRHQNIIVLFNSPYADYFDSSTMKLIHAKFELDGWSKKTQCSYVRGKLLQYNDKLKKFYEHSLQVIEGNRLHKFLGYWSIPKPPKHIFEEYELMKTEFTNRLNAKITQEVAEMERENEPKEAEDTRRPLTPKQEEVMRCLANIKEDNKYQIARQKLGKSFNAIFQSKKFALKKGYKLEEFREDTPEI